MLNPQHELAKEHLFEVLGKNDAPLLAVHAPGRSEISGNHTDHEGGHVIAGALDVAIDGVARANGTTLARVASVGYEPFEIDLTDLEVHEDEKNTSKALVRGMARCLADTGRTPAGFDLALTCSVPTGGGLSSSAAFEAACGRVMEALWEGPAIEPLDLAKMSQYTENVFFGKPCGLMDQASVCLGGLAYINFEDAKNPIAKKLDFDFEAYGYSLVLVNVLADHADLTHEYAAIPEEMQAIAKHFGHERLSELDRKLVFDSAAELRKLFGDRALLRTLHYYLENDLVDERWEALNSADIERFVYLTSQSGKSSAMYLQNVSVQGDVSDQAAMCALALAESYLKGKGAVRIHGGGFGGTIQCFVPNDLVEGFMAFMDSCLASGVSRHYRVCEEGASAQWI